MTPAATLHVIPILTAVNAGSVGFCVRSVRRSALTAALHDQPDLRISIVCPMRRVSCTSLFSIYHIKYMSVIKQRQSFTLQNCACKNCANRAGPECPRLVWRASTRSHCSCITASRPSVNGSKGDCSCRVVDGENSLEVRNFVLRCVGC